VLIRRSRLRLDLRLPLDGFDMFLLTRIEGAFGPTTIQDLVALTPRAPLDTMQRVEQLVQLGILEVEGDFDSEVTQDGIRTLARGEDALTLRPPPKPVSSEDAQTLRPPKPGSIRAGLHASQAVSVEILDPRLEKPIRSSGSASRAFVPGAGNRFRAR
jgi:hypothetical protein